MQKDSIEAMHQNWNPLVQEAGLSSLAREDTVKSLTSNFVLPFCGLSVCLSDCHVHALCSNSRKYRQNQTRGLLSYAGTRLNDTKYVV